MIRKNALREQGVFETVKKLCFFVDNRAAGEREGVKTHLALQ